LTLSTEKIARMRALATPDGVIAALAIDQRKSLRKPIAAIRGVSLEEVTDQMLAEFKSAVARILGPYASAILVDPEYGLDAAANRPSSASLFLTYEVDGFENPRPDRMLSLLPAVSAIRIREMGASGLKILVFYTPFDSPKVNDEKHAIIERVGCECENVGIPFLLEMVGYDPARGGETNFEFARLKPEIVIRSMQEFSKPAYKVDVLKVQVPVNAKFVEGSCVYEGQKAYSYAEALTFFRRAAEVTDKPFIYLSAGVSNREFTEYLRMAAEAGADFSGVLCGRATWGDGIPVYAKNGLSALEDWLAADGVKNIAAVNASLSGAKPWYAKRGLSAAAVA
jgi:tagatose 1,6-diphosphate aldolase